MKIPKKYQKYIKATWQDDDGLWVQLKAGYRFGLTGTTVVSQDTIAEIREMLQSIEEA